MIRSSCLASSAAHCGSCSRSHALALARVLKPSNAWNAGIGDDADAGGARRESDQPDPIPLAHQVIGGHRPVALDQARLPLRVVAPLADVDLGRHAEPRGIAVVSVGALQIQLPGQRPVAARRVDHPARRRLRDASSLWMDSVCGRSSEPNSTDRTRPQDEVDALGQAPSVEFVLQPAAVDLVGGLRHERGTAEFHPPGDVGVAVVGEEHPQPHLADLRRAQVVGQARAGPEDSARRPRRSTRRPCG